MSLWLRLITEEIDRRLLFDGSMTHTQIIEYLKQGRLVNHDDRDPRAPANGNVVAINSTRVWLCGWTDEDSRALLVRFYRDKFGDDVDRLSAAIPPAGAPPTRNRLYSVGFVGNDEDGLQFRVISAAMLPAEPKNPPWNSRIPYAGEGDDSEILFADLFRW